MLEALNQRQVSKLESLAAATGLPKATVNRMLGLLTRAGYARRLPMRRGYTLDDGVLRLSRGYRVEEAIVKAAIGVMTTFTTRYKWPLAIGTRDGNAMRVREVTVGMSPSRRAATRASWGAVSASFIPRWDGPTWLFARRRSAGKSLPSSTPWPGQDRRRRKSSTPRDFSGK